MPTFKRFDGFRIEVRSRDHALPHFHAIGSDFHAMIDIRTSAVLRGEISRRVYAEVRRWASENADALIAEWSRLNERE